MYTIFLTGTAGSGKSTLTSVLKKWYEERESYAITLNLDPGALKLPYEPDVDIRQYIDVQQIMEEYELGPNGAMVAASDLIAVNLSKVIEEVEEYRPDYVIVDTPGQLELFAFRESGPYVAHNLSGEGKVVLFLFDFTISANPFNLLSTVLLYNSLRLRLNLPQIPVLTKIDMDRRIVKKIMEWCIEPKTLEKDISIEREGERYLLATEIFRAFSRLSLIPVPVPVSAITWDGMVNLGSAIANILRGGEEYSE
ncbi:MAG: ATP/GTP-binding protein [Nitrososphaeria archaeon]